MKICPKCGTEHDKSGTFCSRSCANAREWSEESKQKRSIALKQHIIDNPEWLVHTSESVASRVVKQRATLRTKNLELFNQGLIKDRAVLKKWLVETVGDKCAVCGLLPEWCGLPLSLQVDHIDGDNKNNQPNNLRLVCPNCHSQTETFAGKKRK